MTHHLNIAQTLWQAYLEVPDQAAVTLLDSRQADQALNYRELLERSLDYAQAFAEAGIQSGEIVILILQHGLDLLAAFFGALLQGAVPSIMPFMTEKLLPEHYRNSLQALFEITAPAAVVTFADFTAEVQAPAQGAPSIKSILITDQVQHSRCSDPAGLPGMHCHPDTIALLQHSSGTTGLQKGVALSHQALFNQFFSYAKALKLSQEDVIVSWLPLYHDMGLIAGFLLPILSRVHLVLMSPFDWVRAPQRLLRAISSYNGTLCWLPNFAYNFSTQKIRERDLEGVDLSSLRALINCSEPMVWKSHQLFLERFQPYGVRPEMLATCYAMAENVFAVTQGGIESPVTVDVIDAAMFQTQQIARPLPHQDSTGNNGIHMLSAGTPIDGVQLRVLGQRGEALPEREIGEIAIRSNCMLTGYYRRPDLTRKALRDGWYRTGDFGYLADGELYVTGRKKDLIIVGGKNIYPQDIERLAGEAPGIHPGRVVAFGVFNDTLGTEEVVVVAELEDSAALPESSPAQIGVEIRRLVTQGSDIALRNVHLVERGWLLKTSSGKIARAANREKYLQEAT